MFHEHYEHADGEQMHEEGRRGQWGRGPRMHGPHGRHGFGPEHGPHARGDFGPWERPFGPGGFGPGRGPWARGGRGPFGHFGPPWARGGFDPERFAAFQSLRPSIGAVMALLRAADARQLRQIQSVLDDTRKRIAAILAEDQPSQTSEPTQTNF